MKRYFLSLILFPTVLFSQDPEDSVDIRVQPASDVVLKQFPNFDIRDISFGDLTKDGIDDAVVVASPPNNPSDSSSTDEPYVIILKGLPGGNFSYATANDDLFDPDYSYVSLEGGVLTISVIVGHCDREYFDKIFTYNAKKNDWFLTSSRCTTVNCHGGTEGKLDQKTKNLMRPGDSSVPFAELNIGMY